MSYIGMCGHPFYKQQIIMDSIKIVDKLTLRQEALRLAIKRGGDDNYITSALELAKKYEEYLQGSTDLPEYVDPNADKQQWVDMLNKMREEMKPNPWISADSEMKPAKEKDVLCIEGEDVYVARFDGTGWYSSETIKAIEPTHWMPIPPFVEPLKL